ncbi:hypothetical protein [Flavobacterium denitrificans]|uniref:hypothetical protein n=1 Tax=Flavobacterium denitrificans TaxID=281361 RepID=UPI00041C1EBF|nr:hypothetical protein [Flavobacterium denitrificans]
MSNLILSLEALIGDLFGEVSKSFSGTYSNKNKEMRQLIDELNNTEIPSAKNDRANLKKDASNIAMDYKKAFELKKEKY